MSLLSFFGRTRQFESQVAESRSRLWRLAYAWCHSRHVADDLVQDTLAKALVRHNQLRDPAALSGWLCSILANCWHDHLRSHKEVADIDDVDECELPESEQPDDGYAQNEIVRHVRQAVALLPTGQREVVTLVDLEEMSYAEVATILDIPIGTVMSRLSRARTTLRDKLKERTACAAAPTGTAAGTAGTAAIYRLHA